MAVMNEEWEMEEGRDHKRRERKVRIKIDEGVKIRWREINLLISRGMLIMYGRFALHLLTIKIFFFKFSLNFLRKKNLKFPSESCSFLSVRAQYSGGTWLRSRPTLQSVTFQPLLIGPRKSTSFPIPTNQSLFLSLKKYYRLVLILTVIQSTSSQNWRVYGSPLGLRSEYRSCPE